MKRILALAALVLTSTNTALAEPVYLDFTGTITASSQGGAPSGTAVSGGFKFDTESLYRSEYEISPPYRQISYGVYGATGLADTIATLDVGGQVSTWGSSSDLTYGYLGFVDVCQPSGCLAGWGENLSWTAITDNFVSGTDGTFTSRALTVSSANTRRFPDYPFVEFLDYFDGDELTVLSGVTLPLYELIGIYSEQTFTCVAGQCAENSYSLYNFSIDSIDRGIGERVAVPEPATLGLFGLAVGGLLLSRRRKMPSI
jgi:hypothetical protein